MSETENVRLVPEVCANCGRFLRQVKQEIEPQVVHSPLEYNICDNCLKNDPHIQAMLKALKRLDKSIINCYRQLEREYGMMSLPSYHPKFEELLGILDKKPYYRAQFILALRIWRINAKTGEKMCRSWNGELNIKNGKRSWFMQDASELALKRFRLMFGEPEQETTLSTVE